MSTNETKVEIHKVIEHLPDDFLNQVLDYLKQLEKSSPVSLNNAAHLHQILEEDNHLLHKLAQ